MTKEQFRRLGYELEVHVKDWLGNKHKYGVYPNGCGGGINYFENMADINIWYHEVLWNRAVQSGDYDKAERLNIIIVSLKCKVGIPELLKQLGIY